MVGKRSLHCLAINQLTLPPEAITSCRWRPCHQIPTQLATAPSAIGVDSLSGERLAPLAEVLWHGLRRAHPRLTRDEFLDLPITIAELVAALPVVIEQAGGRRVGAEEAVAPEGAAAAGEMLAASASTPSTGARSSPTS